MKLSICIPVYNNKNIFKYSLKAAANSILGFEDKAEIIISDNCSEDDIESVANEIRNTYPTVKILYSRNRINKGPVYNFHRVVEIASGEYCWIIGSDDFILKHAVAKILEIINKRSCISFISLSFAHIDLPSVANNSEDPYKNIIDIIEEGSKLTFQKGPVTTGETKWDNLVDPSFNNVFFGAVMAGIFKKTKWESVDRDSMDKTHNFSNLQNVYPHIYIHANSMIGERAYYFAEPLLVVGDGERPWAGNDFWDGFLPIIYLKVFNEIIEAYQQAGLNSKQLRNCKSYVAHVAGRYLFPYLKQKFIKHKKIKNDKYIDIPKLIKKNCLSPTFYSGIFKGIIKETLMRG